MAWMTVAQAPVETLPVVQPTPVNPVPAVPVAPAPYGPPLAAPPAPYGPPDLEALDRAYGAYYLESKGKGLRVGGTLAVAFGALQMFSSLICLATAAGLHDAGELESARSLGWIGAGLGISGVLHTAGGIPMLIVGKKRQQRYHAWLLGQPRPAARRGFRMLPGAPGAGPLGLTLALRF